ncbi:hypothetical protein CLIM01_02064 [Colletotrichum limetticola]|uniref:Secreted protein n=1 Tax=Colletotrichum limetticola TaxID=1209924 RepID=A0ABQ9Q9Z9_9PEZI|nr:hypothetical protein CLIM01_02064 [Colletotrichum limetticola]
MRLLFHAAVAASSPPWPEIHIDRGRRTETDLDSGQESFFGGDPPPPLPSPPDAWMRARIQSSVQDSRRPSCRIPYACAPR